jgi:CPA2 family monovalent cation:H+ antiporter-2
VIGHSLIQDLVVLYALALPLLLIGGKLRAPAIASLILTGMLAGPGALGLVASQEEVATFAEIGVALALFTVGLELPFGDAWRLWRGVAAQGGAQMAGTMALVVPLAALALGWRLDSVLFVGLFVAVSSTSILVRELTRRNELHAPHGALAVGVLILQDLVALMALVLAPAVFGPSPAGLGGALLQIVVIAAGLTAATRFVLPILFRLATAAGREAFGLMVVVASVGTAWLASTLGLSMTVGAFLAGLVIDETEFSHQIHAEIRPVRDLLTSLFFISVGLLVSPVALLGDAHLVVALALGIVVLKAGGALAALRLVGVPIRVAATAALGLAQVGEFSFVLGTQAVANGAMDAATWQVLLAAGVLTMMATPWLVSAAPALGAWVAGHRPEPPPASAAAEATRDHVIILGFGVGGRIIAGALRAVHRPHIVLELNGAAVQDAAAAGHPILYGDATAAEPLEAAGVARATAVVAVLSDPVASERAVRAVRAINPQVPVIVRTRYRGEAERMSRAGATLVVAEELEASLEVAAQLLARLDVPGNLAESLIVEARGALSAPSSRAVAAPALPSVQVSSAIGETPVTSHVLAAGEWAVGRGLSTVDLRARTGATILAVRRGTSTLAPPPVPWEFATGDVLYIVGDDAALRRARGHLTVGPDPPAGPSTPA